MYRALQGCIAGQFRGGIFKASMSDRKHVFDADTNDHGHLYVGMCSLHAAPHRKRCHFLFHEISQVQIIVKYFMKFITQKTPQYFRWPGDLEKISSFLHFPVPMPMPGLHCELVRGALPHYFAAKLFERIFTPSTMDAYTPAFQMILGNLNEEAR